MSFRQRKQVDNDGDQKVRARRIDVKRSVVVESRTIGAPMVFAMATENLSRTGLLLAGSIGYKIPFQVNTILEMNVDTRRSLLREPISCLGKIVRIVERDQKREFFGVQIIHMEPKELQFWEKTLGELESALPPLPPDPEEGAQVQKVS